MLNKLSLVLLGWSLVFSQAVVADPHPASHYYWQNSNYNSHYVLYDYASRTYVETVDCKIFWRFTLVSNVTNTLTLFDASRGMTVQLTYEGMFLKPQGSTGFTFYQAGTFDTRTQFQHFDQNGTYTGALTKQHACAWVEYLAGSHTPNWYFKEVERHADFVDLYDQSRDMLVRLTQDSMFLRTGSHPLAFFKKGHW